MNAKPALVTESRPAVGPHARRSARVALTALVAILVVAINLLQACSFKGQAGILETPADVYDALDSSVYVTPEVQDRWSVIDEPLLKVEHGESCARAPWAATEDHLGLRIIENHRLPTGFDGTVFLNGWLVEYKGTDHHVVGTGTTIFNIVKLNNQLVWNAGGVIGDAKGKVGYRWCYSYTVMAWKKPSTDPTAPVFDTKMDIDAIVSDPQAKLMYVDNGSLTTGGLHTFGSSFRTKGKPPRARLLAGFGHTFTGDDHHVLQVGLDLGVPKIRRKRIRWSSDVVFKDNGTPRYRSAEIVSILRGESVAMWRPQSVILERGDGVPGVYPNDLTLTARSPSSCPSNATPAEQRTHYAITGVPYTWAIPMLTGWDIGDPCDDNHVKFVGAQLEDWHYERNPGDASGTLYYTVVTRFADKDQKPGMVDRVQVDVLGVNPILPPGKDPGAA